uniref:Uncharacterized protein n=1 Tax=Amphora coffeiformis TaxID=265554 RepID=A0A7S3P4U2_9STRA|mmetsp:Transcript_10122/g.19470  ORF Transcript_10122/g.19470 Transcript_10122/m.19470 type:complete len:278 (+) Transcript_10122:85-918(+)
MPRFRDEWVIDRVMFDYVSGGSCACCGFQHFLPNGTADLVDALSDLDTDQANHEKAALANHPWPADVRDQVWADRVRLRQKLKRDRTRFGDFWQAHADGFAAWLHQPETITQLRRWLQLPRTEVMEVIQQKYNIHSAFAVVLCAIVEQVAGFHLTQYPPDGRGAAERDFETKLLIYDRRGGFMLPMVSEEGDLQEDLVNIWFRRMQTLAGAVLLERGTSSSKADGDEEEDGDPDGPTTKDATPSFASDRRVIRLVIARIFADMLQEKYLETTTPTTT